ncbi:MAG: (2Fe-2S) ferredoxin domain-containing protein [Firmicutes bacterium]|nr:(2Fe-2S) ferredoxin domain-containing protein [Bacillota bacterium]
MKSLEDLKKLRESAQQIMRLREGGESIRIVMGMGTCGIAAGARETLAAIMEELQAHNLHDVIVTQTGCAGLCDKEPLVDVIWPGQPRISYGNVDAERARQIVLQHVKNKQVVEEWVIRR